jgi:pimeloyl-ACP methyl ester carboxylesterase
MLVAVRSVVATAGGRPGSGYRQTVSSVRKPALLIHGAKDRLVPVAASIAMVERHPNWQLVVLPDTGHVPMLEAPHDTAHAINDWLTGPASASAAQAKGRIAEGG